MPFAILGVRLPDRGPGDSSATQTLAEDLTAGEGGDEALRDEDLVEAIPDSARVEGAGPRSEVDGG